MPKSKRRRIDDARIAREQLYDPEYQRELREATNDKRANRLLSGLKSKLETFYGGWS